MFTEKAKTVDFTTVKGIPIIRIKFLDDTKQRWDWQAEYQEWVRNDKVK